MLKSTCAQQHSLGKVKHRTPMQKTPAVLFDASLQRQSLKTSLAHAAGTYYPLAKSSVCPSPITFSQVLLSLPHALGSSSTISSADAPAATAGASPCCFFQWVLPHSTGVCGLGCGPWQLKGACMS